MNDLEGSTIKRRELLGGLAAGSAIAVASLDALPAAAAQAKRKRYVSVGVGSRNRMYQQAIWGPHKAHAELVAAVDTNPGRLALVGKLAGQNGAPAPKPYLATEFDKMVREQRPDVIIVTTPDTFHDDYLVRALEAGCDVLTEKPMTTTPEKAQRILDAVKRTGRHIRITHNYRYAPYRSQVKELLMSGEIGDVLSVDFHWLLNTSHGADYFRRWHSNKAMSGGLMIHKASHHFDLVNWWLSDMPVEVQAVGKRDFYTPAMAKRFGLVGGHERCHTCPETGDCTFFFSLKDDPALKAMYLDAEKYDGYFRDQCVWRPEISIEDTMNVIVKYQGGATLSYSLNAFNAWEGYTIAFNGTKGRLEHVVIEQAGISGLNGSSMGDEIQTRIIPMRGDPRDIPPATGAGGHGGGDTVMLAEIFDPNAPADPLLRRADERAGAASALIGMAANRCFQTGQPVKIADLVTGLTAPDYPRMPDHDGKVPMPRPLTKA
ncbi:Gfo/Idh/MocA family oxidoreductase [Sphingomonas sp. AP4-R1]|uniref:Gfo/Idh/MocA family oxidoreductase n=1 Tax=Sphingomonas sp. AP4-R1 TaxID=2735134 RepID=UPI0014934367|nr:Gfo/Idh/MocA family oxidoreductase [Sphingomonas sp. AP4-R1]QJU59094.1 Gfo/Idh/MocA family oxidoreductase [Sphingomonas sp. AP4-R1]